jgi:hypothetical protein
MPRGIDLARSAQTIYNSNAGSGYRFTVTADNGLNMDTNVFRYTRQPFNFTPNTTADLFEGVCSPEQMVSLPIGVPNPGDPNQYFRLNTLDLVCQTRALADETWTLIQADVATLIKAINQSEVLTPPLTVRIGDS